MSFAASPPLAITLAVLLSVTAGRAQTEPSRASRPAKAEAATGAPASTGVSGRATTERGTSDAAALEQARQWFREGLSLEAAGDWSTALARFEQVAAVKLTPQVRFHVALCKEKLGRLTEAWGDYRIAEYDAEAAGAPELELIRQSRVALEARVPRLTVVLQGASAGATVRLDGVALGQASLGQPMAVDVGEHELVVTLSDGRELRRSVSVAEGANERTVIEVPAAAPPPIVVGPAPIAERSSRIKTRTWILGGAGVAALGGAGVLWYLRGQAIDDLDKGCRGSVCPESLRSTQNKGEAYSLWAPITAGVGVAAVGVAALDWWLGSRRAPAKDRGVSWSVVPVAGGAGVGGSF